MALLNLSLVKGVTPSLLDVLACVSALWLIFVLYQRLRTRSLGTKLRGPPAKSLIWGVGNQIATDRSADLFERWAAEYGHVFRIPLSLGTDRIVLTDPRAIAHVLNTNSYNYVRPPGGRVAIRHMLGDGILSAEGDDHKRQRKVLNPGFTPQAVRTFTEIFLESAHKVEEQWDAVLEESNTGDALIDVQKWMNRISLDTIGLAGFAYDFKTLQGAVPTVVTVFEAISNMKRGFLTAFVTMMLASMPFVMKLPSQINILFGELNTSMGEIVRIVLSREKERGNSEHEERMYMLGPLLKEEEQSLSRAELVAQMKTLILAGYETTSTSLSWCLHELSMRPALQQRLRDELARFPEPTYDQMMSQMPILDSIVRETLRVHPAVGGNERVADSDDAIPMSKPLMTADGTLVDHIDVAAGQLVLVSIETMNMSKAFWGPTGHDFDPDRWLKSEVPLAAQEIQGFHHLLTFIDGPRACIGKNFAVAEFKAVLSVLMRKYTFAPSDGTGLNVEWNRGILKRPRTKGTEGLLLLRVRAVES